MSEFYKPEKINMVHFSLGQTVMTSGVMAHINRKDEIEAEEYEGEIMRCLLRHMDNDWGDLPEEDWLMNDIAVRDGEDRLFSCYNLSDGEKIYIITEADRSVTTILFPSEY